MNQYLIAAPEAIIDKARMTSLAVPIPERLNGPSNLNMSTEVTQNPEKIVQKTLFALLSIAILNQQG